MDAFLDEVGQACGSRGVDHLLLVTDQDLADALCHFLYGRDRSQAQPTGPQQHASPHGPHERTHFPESTALVGAVFGRRADHHSPPLSASVSPHRLVPMRYLKISIQKNRCRVRLEQLLLLLLRTLAVLVLFLIVARPVVHGGAGHLAGRRGRHQPTLVARRFTEHGLSRRGPFVVGAGP